MDQPSQPTLLPGLCIGTEPAQRTARAVRKKSCGPTLKKWTSEDEDVSWWPLEDAPFPNFLILSLSKDA
jgi:hypothetical protein